MNGYRLNNSALGHIAGIDFGTSNSSVGLFRNGAPELLDATGQGRYIPSAIFYASETDEISFGKQAFANYTEDVERRLLRSRKSVLGNDIASRAGFKHIEFQYEPIAAALNYESTLDTEALVLFVDIGGGTADFSVVRASPGRHALHDRSNDVLGNMGVHVGGTDFDRLLSLQSVMPDLGFGTHVRNSVRLLPKFV